MTSEHSQAIDSDEIEEGAMNVADLEVLEAIRETLAAVSGLRTVRLIRTDESIEIPLSRLPAAVLEPCGV